VASKLRRKNRRLKKGTGSEPKFLFQPEYRPREVPVPFFQPRRGFSLLEVILALSLTVMIMAGISLAISLHLRTLDKRQTQVEVGQLGRALLNKVATDLRMAISYRPMDFSGVASASSTAASDGSTPMTTQAGIDSSS